MAPNYICHSSSLSIMPWNKAAVDVDLSPLRRPSLSTPGFEGFTRQDSTSSDEGVVVDIATIQRAVPLKHGSSGTDVMDCEPNRRHSAAAIDEDDMKIARNRLHSFTNWPATSPSPTELTAAGFFFTGQEDIVQCAFCEELLGNWQSTDRPLEEHRRHYPHCPFVVSRARGHSTEPHSSHPSRSSDGGSSSDSDLAGEDVCGWFFPCRNPEPLLMAGSPKRPEMALYKDRFATFALWPQGKSQQPRDLASAGLFYTGHADLTSCFACGGNLHRWEPRDDPWVEHARLYPQCEYLIASKGRAFVAAVRAGAEEEGEEVEMFSESSRLSPEHSYVLTRASLTNSSQGSSTGSSSSPSSGIEDESSLPSSHDSDRFSDRSMSDEESEQEIIGHAVMRNSNLMDAIQEAVAEQRQNLPFSRFLDETRLVEAAKAIQCRKELQKKTLKEEAEREKVSIPNDLASLTKEYERLKQERMCKVCLVQESRTIFHPCGHLVCCAPCSDEVRTCPVCRAVILQKSRAYLV